MAETKKKLPVNEWDFSSIEPALVPYAFFYEYSRQSDKVKELVALYREILPYLYELEMAPGDGWFFVEEAPGAISEDKKAELIAKTEQFTETEYLFLIRWLGRCEKFPDTPFLELEVKDYRNGPDIAVNAYLFPVNGQGFCDIGYCWMRDLKEDTFCIENPFSIFCKLPPVAGRGPYGEHVTANLIRVDWWKTDNELKEEFSAWVEDFRRHIKVEPVKAGTRGILNQPLDLPK